MSACSFLGDLGGGGGDQGDPGGAEEPAPACEGARTFAALASRTAVARWTCDRAAASVEVAAPFAARLVTPTEIDVTFAPSARGRFEVELSIDGVAYTLAGDSGRDGVWDPMPDTAECGATKGPLLAQAIELAAMPGAELSISTSEIAASAAGVANLIFDELMLDQLGEIRADPSRAGCLEDESAVALDGHVAGQTPVSGSIRHAARLLGEDIAEPPLDPRAPPGSFEDAVRAICGMYQSSCAELQDGLPSDLRDALAPILWAIQGGIAARLDRDATLEGSPRDAEWWRAFGGNVLMPSPSAEAYNPSYDKDRAYLAGGRKPLYRAAAEIALAIEKAELGAYAGRTGVRFDLPTPAGVIRVRGAEDDRHEDGAAVLLSVDLGGDDVHAGAEAANIHADNAVSVAIDLGGDDLYQVEGDDPRYGGDSRFAAVTLSDRFRQGAARNGIALLFDLGAGHDSYRALRGSQGYAHQGVGVLFDDGGDDRYEAEAFSQGSAQYGIAILADAGGADEYSAFHAAQGFGFAGGAGLLVDGDGGDVYHCDSGDPAHGGAPLYLTPQIPGKSNASFCQGAGFGFRHTDPKIALSGGIGVLRDRRGDDRYGASVYAQGTGYWQGIGVLSDGAGADRYNAFWYAQGSGVHYAAGVFADGGEGGDTFGADIPEVWMVMGAGHDHGIGAFVNESGADSYHLPGLSAGSASCSSIGLFVDNSGDDTYVAGTIHTGGVSTEGQCAGTSPSTGILIDASGNDTYLYPDHPAAPGNGKTWGHGLDGKPGEHGAGIDAEGETGVHAGRAR